jgi:hypothetical protein
VAEIYSVFARLSIAIHVARPTFLTIRLASRCVTLTSRAIRLLALSNFPLT